MRKRGVKHPIHFFSGQTPIAKPQEIVLRKSFKKTFRDKNQEEAHHWNQKYAIKEGSHKKWGNVDNQIRNGEGQNSDRVI